MGGKVIVIQSQEDWEKEMADAKEQGKTVRFN